jgi:hypothetical protein
MVGAFQSYASSEVFSITNGPENLSESLAQQDEKQISGKVTSANGETIPRVSVIIEGTTKGVITDIDGNFSLTISE